MGTAATICSGLVDLLHNTTRHAFRNSLLNSMYMKKLLAEFSVTLSFAIGRK